MNWDEDIDLLAGGKKSAPKLGRRSSSNITEAGDLAELPPEVPLRTRKTGVWSDEAPSSKSAKNRGSTNIIEQERFQVNSTTIDDNNDDIPVIPDVDDLPDDPLNLPDVKPNVTVDKSTYKELDSQLDLKGAVGGGDQLNFGNLGDIDLSFLTGKLYPEKEVAQSNSDVWTIDSLFTDLSKC